MCNVTWLSFNLRVIESLDDSRTGSVARLKHAAEEEVL